MKLTRRCARALIFALWCIGGTKFQAFCQPISGNFAVSAGTTSTTSYFSFSKFGLGSLSASLPLSARNEFLEKLSLTAKIKIGAAELFAGKVRIGALGYFASNETGSVRGPEGLEQLALMKVSSLGAPSDPWGLAINGAAFSLATTVAQMYSSASVQWRVLHIPLDIILSAGTLYAMDAVSDFWAHFHPWLALGLRSAWDFGEVRFRTQIYPGLDREVESLDMGAPRGAAGRLDLWLALQKIDLYAGAYLQSGEFISAGGTLSSYDAVVDATCRVNLSALPLIKEASISLSSSSMRGVRQTLLNEFPAYGVLEDSLFSRYMPDIETIAIELEGTRVEMALFGHALAGSLELGASAKKSQGKSSFSLKGKTNISVRGHSERALSFEAMLTGEQEECAETSTAFSDIQNLEDDVDNSTDLQQIVAEHTLFSKCTLSLKASGPSVSFSSSIGIPLGSASSNGISGRLRVAFALPHWSFEASTSMKYARSPAHFSISSARVYVRIPF